MDDPPRPRLLWRPAARVGAAVTFVVAAAIDLWTWATRREPRRWSDLDQARRARAARLINERPPPEDRPDGAGTGA